ncbi:MAG: sugar ABC transporter ATP-binding protein [Anaerolineae bacterium]|nr:sugar ABC transporter ATP-binding protein [Anaerolineae bacterium]
MSSTPLFSIRHASKSYNGIPALIDASLDLLGGEVHALMGENGAGKSTLIKMLAGVLSADTINLTLRGKPVTIHDAQAAFDLGLRFIHQELNIVPQLSVAENIFLSQRYPRRAGILVNWRKLHQDTRDVLAQLGITHLDPRTIIARLSPGDQMLVKIASAFVGSEQSNASVYVMDEPTAALTGEETARLFQVIQRLREQGCAILYVSHRLDEIFQIANRVTVMRDGRVVATKPIAETSAAELIQLMTGRALQQVYPPRETPVGDAVLLDVQNLHTAVVSHISFQLRSGEILGIAGLNGSGRTELIRALMGADRLLGGTVTLAGAPLKHRAPAGAWHNGLAFVPEERRSQGLILSRSIGNNITLPHLGWLSRGGLFLDNAHERQLANTLGGSVRLKAKGAQQTIRELSGGNQQKVVFARALARNPRVLLLDEPTRGVDVGAKFDIYTLIRQISAQGTGILMVSSDLTELIGLCDRILIMRRGQLVDTVAASGLTEESLLALCYGELTETNRDR